MNYLLLTITVVSVAISIFLVLRSRVTNVATAPRARRRGAEADRTYGPVSTPALATEILERMSEGVIVLDQGVRPEYANDAARRLLGLRPGALPARLPSQDVIDTAKRSLETSAAVEELVETWYPERATLFAKAAPLERDLGVMVVLQDVSDEVETHRMRREFVAHASHELKTPVAGVQALADAVGQAIGDDDQEAAARFAGRLIGESERLAKLVTDLLDLSRLEDPGHLPETTCDLAEVARHEIQHAEQIADDDDPAITHDIVARMDIIGDRQQLSLMIRNLVENAVRYTPVAGHVEVAVYAQDSDAVLQVKDDGPGIPQEVQGRIFERFYRGDRARTRAEGGTGLGLSIVKHVVELHGGNIELDSELGRGSTFTVRIPAATSETSGLSANQEESADATRATG
jgi:two-component system sensor histidine kinase SenX3